MVHLHLLEAILKIFARAIFEVIEVKGGHMVKERDFETEKYQNEWLKIKHPILVVRLEMGQNQQSLLKNQIKSTGF